MPQNQKTLIRCRMISYLSTTRSIYKGQVADDRADYRYVTLLDQASPEEPSLAWPGPVSTWSSSIIDRPRPVAPIGSMRGDASLSCV